MAFCFSCYSGDKIHNPAQTITESVYCHRGNQETLESARGSLGSACDQGERAAGGNPISHVQVVSSRRFAPSKGDCLGLCVCVGGGARGCVAGRSALTSRLPPGQNEGHPEPGQQWHRHHLKMAIKVGSLHQEVHFTLIIKHEGKGSAGLYWTAL